jgi:hypothetical protein
MLMPVYPSIWCNYNNLFQPVIIMFFVLLYSFHDTLFCMSVVFHINYRNISLFLFGMF